MNYNETRDKYLKYKRDMISAEKDEMCSNIMQTVPKPQNVKMTPKMTPKRKKIFFVRDYMKEYGKITAKGLARKYENIFRNTKRKPDKQLIKDFTVILTDLVDMGILKKNGSYRGNITYTKIINPNNLKGLREVN